MLFRTISFGFSADPITTKLANCIFEYGNKIEYLDIRGRVSVQGMEKVSKLKSLKKLTLRHSWKIHPRFTSDNLVSLANHCPNLTHLHLSSFQSLNDNLNNEDVKSAFKLFFEKKYLTLKSLILMLEEGKEEDYQYFEEASIGCLEFLHFCLSLEELRTDFVQMTKKDFLAIAKLNNLKYLQLSEVKSEFSNSSNLTSQDYNMLFATINLNNLEFLSIGCDLLLDKTTIQKMILRGGFPKLEKLSLNRTRNLKLNKQLLEKFIAKCPLLKEITLEWVKGFLPHSFMTKIKHEKKIDMKIYWRYRYFENHYWKYHSFHNDNNSTVLDSVPDKIWLKIFSYLPTSEIRRNKPLIANCFNRTAMDLRSLTNMNLNEIEIKDQSLALQKMAQANNLTQLEISHYLYCNKTFLCIDIEHLLSLALQLNQNVKILKITKHRCNHPPKKYLIKIINDHGNNIEHLDLDINIPNESLALLSKMKKLKVLKFRSNSISFSYEAIKALSECPILEDVLISNFGHGIPVSIEFSVWNMNIQSSFDTFFENEASTLKHFAFHPFGEYPNRCRFYSKAFRPGILKNIPLCQELETLSLKDGHVNEEDLKNITMLANLKVLVLHHIKTEDLKPLFVSNNMINLVKIVISDIPANADTLITSAMFHESGRFPKLEEIYLDQCRQMVLSDLSLEKLIQAFPKLKKISLCGIANALSDEYLFKLKNEGKLDIVLDDKKNHLVTKYGRYHSPSQLTISE